uniref:ATP-binding cassette sub-family G member 18 n=1 Tax=Diaphorina citri TaxID=121845 RepID=A0A482LQN3_DIACI|nr:ATP-binding cassette sub-family G member 18 [Diaphorina citri]QER78504.1 ATP-binding cassette transporter [Diaphorina citri]
MDVEFEDLTYRIEQKSLYRKCPAKTILKSVSGRFRAGELSAILGPSGAGKSSLLNVISGYVSNEGIEGKLKVNGQSRDEKLFRKMSCYIMQEDLLQPLLTLQEVMLFAAELKLPSDTPKKDKLKLIHEIQSMLGLSECRHTRTESLSGGQKKRLSIAVELINNPPVLFLDEPTSGLDNVSTTSCLKLLRNLAHQGRTIVCTIHQPSATLFSFFDNVYVLAVGQCIYQGATEQLVPFLSSVGLKCPTHYNPADYVIELTEDEENIAILSSATNNGKHTRFKSITQVPGTDQISNGNIPTRNLDMEVMSHNLVLSYMGRKGEGKGCVNMSVSCWYQFLTLYQRMTLQLLRNKIGLKIQFYHHLMCGLAVGIVFMGKSNDGTQFFNHMKFCMGVILFHTYTQCMVQVLLFPTEVKLLKKEYFNQWYGLRPYFLALQLSKAPFLIFFSLIFLVLVYFMSGLPVEWERFTLFCTVGILVCFTAEGMGLFIGSIFNVTNGSAVGPLTIAPFLGLAIYGFDFARVVPWYMRILMRLSFLRCGVVSLIIAVFGLGRGSLSCEGEVYCHFKNPKTLIYYLDLEKASPWTEVGYLVLMLILYRLITYVGLKRRLAV